MNLRHSLWLYRFGLVAALLLPSLNCAGEESSPEGCGCGDACSEPEPPLPDDDDSSFVDDDDSALIDDDDDSARIDDDDVVDDDDSTEIDLTALLSVCSGGVLAAVEPDALQAPGPGSEGYGYEPEDRLAALQQSFGDLLDGRPGAAVTTAFLVNYELCRGDGEETGLALWRPAAADRGGARIVFRSLGASQWIVEAPHAGSVPASVEAAAAVFEAWSARVLVVGGTHRCASSIPSDCDAPSACDDGRATISDMAAWTESVFHVAHEVFTTEFDDDVLSLDGMDGFGVSLSDGTTNSLAEAAPEDHAVAEVATALATWGENVTACNNGLDVPVEFRACGESSVQARSVNDPEIDPCLGGAPLGSGRWVYLAASDDLLGPDTPLAGLANRLAPGP